MEIDVQDWLDEPPRPLGKPNPIEARVRLVLEIMSMPAWKIVMYKQTGLLGRVFCTYLGTRYEIVGVSVFGTMMAVDEFGTKKHLRIDKCEGWEYHDSVVNGSL